LQDFLVDYFGRLSLYLALLRKLLLPRSPCPGGSWRARNGELVWVGRASGRTRKPGHGIFAPATVGRPESRRTPAPTRPPSTEWPSCKTPARSVPRLPDQRVNAAATPSASNRQARWQSRPVRVSQSYPLRKVSGNRITRNAGRRGSKRAASALSRASEKRRLHPPGVKSRRSPKRCVPSAPAGPVEPLEQQQPRPLHETDRNSAPEAKEEKRTRNGRPRNCRLVPLIRAHDKLKCPATAKLQFSGLECHRCSVKICQSFGLVSGKISLRGISFLVGACQNSRFLAANATLRAVELSSRLK
jgi:hypothetical protein